MNNSIWDEKRAALKEVWEKWRCNHEETLLTRRTVSGGAVHYQYQCVRCGQTIGPFIRQEDARKKSSVWPLPLYDAAKREEWATGFHDEHIKVVYYYGSLGDQEADQRKEEYREYLLSHKWAQTRKKVLERDEPSY